MTRQRKTEIRRGKRSFDEKFQDQRQSMIVNIEPKNDAQRFFIKALKENKIVIANGSAGTGKTFIAATHAANAYLRDPSLTLYLARPYIPMGRSAGLLPGTLEEKMAPYLAPLISVLKNQMGEKYVADFGKNIHVQLIEAIRGTDLKDSILLIDEAQNLTIAEIKSIVTRLGDNSQIILTGDSYQSDLKPGESGLDWLCDLIEKYNIDGAEFVEFLPEDIVRSGLVKKFVQIFDKEDSNAVNSRA